LILKKKNRFLASLVLTVGIFASSLYDELAIFKEFKREIGYKASRITGRG